MTTLSQGAIDMTDLQINVALAKAMGWLDADMEPSYYHPDRLMCNDHKLGGYRIFDYRDPVVFVAICKHWKLSVQHSSLVCYCQPTFKDFSADTIEKAAALCVIDSAK
jgi:hypothetical protein